MPFKKNLAALFVILPALFALPCVPGAPAFLSAQAQTQAAPSDASDATVKKPVTVTSDTMEAVTEENRVIFRGNVMAVEDFTLCSDELQILYGQDRDVSRIEALGNVRIFKDDKSSTSGRVVYDREQRTLVLTGKPQVTQCTDMIKGDRITLYLDRDDAVVESDDGGRVRAVIMPEKGCEEAGESGGEEQGEEALCKGTR